MRIKYLFYPKRKQDLFALGERRLAQLYARLVDWRKQELVEMLE